MALVKLWRRTEKRGSNPPQPLGRYLGPGFPGRVAEAGEAYEVEEKTAHGLLQDFPDDWDLDVSSKVNEESLEGSTEEEVLAALVALRGIGEKSAKELYDAGFRSPAQVLANPDKVGMVVGLSTARRVFGKR